MTFQNIVHRFNYLAKLNRERRIKIITLLNEMADDEGKMKLLVREPTFESKDFSSSDNKQLNEVAIHDR